MEAVKTPILEGITREEQEQMRVCFGVREERFRAGETVYDFAEGRKYLGLIARGSAVIQRIDRQGGLWAISSCTSSSERKETA